jgi:hypothetical protein
MENNKFGKFSGTQDLVVLTGAIGLVAAWFIAYIYFAGIICI